MGAGKTTVGRRLAAALKLPFVDADHEIEVAAGCTINDIFDRFGEAAFRDGERKVIARLLEQPRHVLATGGGAFADPETRERVKNRGLAIWLRADIELLLKRVARRDTRPMLRSGDPAETMKKLMDERYPLYAQAHLTVDTADGPHDSVVKRVVQQLQDFIAEHDR
jgi:shikimate kinase